MSDPNGTPGDGSGRDQGGGDEAAAEVAQPEVTVESLRAELDKLNKRVEDSQAEVRRAHSERDSSQAHLDKMQKLAEKLADDRQQRQETQDTMRQRFEGLKDQIRNDPSVLADVLPGWFKEAEDTAYTRAKQDFEKELGEVRGSLGTMSERVVKTSPEYQRNQAMIEDLRASGMSLEKAMDLAVKHGKAAEPAQREPPPGSLGGLRPGREAPMLSRDEQRAVEAFTGPLTPEEQKELRERAARGRRA